jgi:hypothetical protein
MSAEPPAPTIADHQRITSSRLSNGPWGADAAAVFVTRTLPVLQALDDVLAEDTAGLAQVLSVAEEQRPGATAALAAALAAEAEHLRQLAIRAEAAVARLRQSGEAAEPDTTIGPTIPDA